ncbi:MAG: EVE domain-containing protein [Bacteroidia bacterium]|jgi:predicted RNA-binding protein with PUA-like domain
MQYWLIKSEPFKYSWDQFVADKRTFWDGVRNYQARNNLMQMAKGDLCIFYHSNEGKEAVGIAKVVKTHYPDPTAADEPGDWVVVDVAPQQKLKRPVTLAEMKADPRLSQMGLIRQSRLSVVALTKTEFDIIVAHSEG